MSALFCPYCQKEYDLSVHEASGVHAGASDVVVCGGCFQVGLVVRGPALFQVGKADPIGQFLTMRKLTREERRAFRLDKRWAAIQRAINRRRAELRHTN